MCKGGQYAKRSYKVYCLSKKMHDYALTSQPPNFTMYVLILINFYCTCLFVCFNLPTGTGVGGTETQIKSVT